MAEISPLLLQNWRFEIKLIRSAEAESGQSGTSQAPSGSGGGRLADGAFQECSGLEVEMDIKEYQEGGRNDGVIKQVGRGKYGNIVLKRGMFHSKNGEVNGDLWTWLQNILAGVRPVARYDGQIEVWGPSREIVATWSFVRGLPSKVAGPTLNAKTGDVALEELHISHEGLRLEG